MAACLAAQQNPDLMRDGKLYLFYIYRLTFIIICKVPYAYQGCIYLIKYTVKQ